MLKLAALKVSGKAVVTVYYLAIMISYHMAGLCVCWNTL